MSYQEHLTAMKSSNKLLSYGWDIMNKWIQKYKIYVVAVLQLLTDCCIIFPIY